MTAREPGSTPPTPPGHRASAPAPAPAPAPKRSSTTFRALTNHNFRVYFAGQGLSLCGTWTQQVGQAWLVLHLSHDSGVAVGFAAALQYVPIIVLGAWAGVVADRVDKRKLIIGAQAAQAVAAAVLAVLTITEVVELWMVFVLAAFAGIGNAIDQPSRQAFVSEMVEPRDLVSAVGLNSALFNSARVVGPAIAGVIIHTVGTGICFVVNAASFLAVITSLVLMRADQIHASAPVPRAKGQIRAGFEYVWRTPVLRSNVLLIGIVSTLSFNWAVILPLLAKVTFHGDESTYTILAVAMGIGSLGGALICASRPGASEPMMIWSSVGFGAFIMIAALMPTAWSSILPLFIVGMFSITLASTSNARQQLNATPTMRGRALAVRAIFVTGSTVVGAPLSGWMCDQWGPRWAMLFGGMSAVISALWFRSFIAERRSPQPTAGGGALESA